MSFYSSLCLVANTGVRRPAPDEISRLFAQTGVVEPSRAQNEFGNLADDLIAFFTSHRAQEQNERFFTPDSLSFRNDIQIMDTEGEYTGKGWTLSIHGNGYFYPLTPRDMDAFVRLPKIVRLQTELETLLGGRFRPPLLKGRGTLARTAINDQGGWRWFGSQSM